MSDFAIPNVWIPKGITSRREPIVEEGVLDETPIVTVWRQEHPLIPVLSAKVAQSHVVQMLGNDLIKRGSRDLRNVFVKNREMLQVPEGRVLNPVIPLDLSDAIEKTAKRIKEDLHQELTQRIQEKNEKEARHVIEEIRALSDATPLFQTFFKEVGGFTLDTDGRAINAWELCCCKRLFRVDVITGYSFKYL